MHYRSFPVFSLGPWSAQLPTRFFVPGGTHVRNLPGFGAGRYGALTRSGDPFQRSSRPRRTPNGTAAAAPVAPSNPGTASPAGCAAAPVWAPPRSLAATEGILSVPRGTEMFQFPRCPRGRPRAESVIQRVAPFGDLRITSRQRFPGAFRRVATSFVGRKRLGIHRAPIMRSWSSGSRRVSNSSAPPDTRSRAP